MIFRNFRSRDDFFKFRARFFPLLFFLKAHFNIVRTFSTLWHILVNCSVTRKSMKGSKCLFNLPVAFSSPLSCPFQIDSGEGFHSLSPPDTFKLIANFLLFYNRNNKKKRNLEIRFVLSHIRKEEKKKKGGVHCWSC